jgi:hypothetical protein
MYLFQNYCMLILMYGGEVQAWTEENISTLTAAERRFLRNNEG